MDVRNRLQQLGWALPWLLFQVFPIAHLLTAPGPTGVRIAAGAALVVFTAAYLTVLGKAFAPGCSPSYRGLAVVAVLGVGLGLWLGTPFAGLMIYLSAAVAVTLPERWIWPAVVGATAVCAGVLTAGGMLGELFFLPLLCLLTAFALRGTRYLIGVNSELTQAREELARSAVAEERMRFARDLHDLLGHSLSLIALKSELAGRLAERDPARARQEMADVEAAARRALAEVRDAVSGYRQVSLAQALAEARSALSAAGITLRAQAPSEPLPAAVDAVLGWVVREATTNVLRHSGARSMTVDLAVTDDGAALTVTDDGRGGDAPRGTGLAGLAERVEAVGGRLEAGPAPGRGFRLLAVVPAHVPADPAVVR
ncbi:sensor histidine kinase [Blastococcus haudaquaticus]|uniref:Two-component system, NarL family, sensor histidine kinase DesK n=1 Tax=Blastococcus haudaquaticus TaxID=1938745 RepID=A0A286H2X9_9ACTN|nr:histidine kinase [Blastococcus haudaquaticus]SOE02145.1 two-component system, NarL family, sensor histidine kinase DesK [Blastococcus haudaquaticus]